MTVRMTFPMSQRYEAEINGELVRLEPNPHRLLEVMLLRGRELTTVGSLIEALWPDPDFEPDWAESAIHVYLMRLRRSGVRIFCQYSLGYRIAIAGDVVKEATYRSLPTTRHARRERTRIGKPTNRRYELQDTGLIMGERIAA
jgi:DNA-binding SARP family transcriptional activator